MESARAKVIKCDEQIEAATREVNLMKASLKARISAASQTNPELVRTLEIEAELEK